MRFSAKRIQRDVNLTYCEKFLESSRRLSKNHFTRNRKMPFNRKRQHKYTY